MVVESIYYRPPGKNPHNITWRFLQSRGATAWDRTSLEVPQTSAQGWPRHLEQEMRGGPLNLYTSVFRGGPILLGVELPEEDAAQEVLPKEEAAQEVLPEDEVDQKVPPGPPDLAEEAVGVAAGRAGYGGHAVPG
jgi:hypothetical protein